MKYVILLSGKINSGKNLYAEYLANEFKNKNVSVKQDLYASDLKNYSVNDFKLLGKILDDKVENVKSIIGMYFDPKFGLPMDVKDYIFNELDTFKFHDFNFFEDKTDITRVLLQIYGTDIARKRFDDHFWIKSMAKRIDNDTSDVIIVTDVRFPNEIDELSQYLKEKHVIVPVRIERGNEQQKHIKQHESETALDNYKYWEYIIDNNGTLDDLRKSANAVSNALCENMKGC